MAFLTEQDQKSVSEAIRAAESRTTGEIVTVIAQQSDSYTGITLLLPTLLALVIPGFAAPSLGIVAAGDLFLVQLALFAFLYVALMIPAVWRLVVPHSIQRQATRQLARQQFVERQLHLTQGRTGVLIFVSVAERHVEILADTGIDSKVAPDAWQSIIDVFVVEVRAGRIREGFVAAITQVGERLAFHFPNSAKNPNELPDHLYVI